MNYNPFHSSRNVREKMKAVFIKYKWLILWLILGVIFFYPFCCLLIGEIWCLKELYTFGLPLKDFMTIWIAFWGVIGVAFNIILMQRRVSNQEKQLIDQKEQFEKQQRDTRFSSGVELLGNPHESARIGGVYNLYFLANEHQNEYLHSVCEILCAHVRTITNDIAYQEKYKEKPSNEIQSILNLLFKKDKNDELIFDKCQKNFERTFFGGANLEYATLSNVDFRYAKLDGVKLFNATLSIVKFQHAVLIGVNFGGCNKSSGVYFQNAELNNINFNDAKINGGYFMNAKLCVVYFWESELSNILFYDAKLLSDVNFWNTKLSNIDFSNAKLKENEINFTGTLLEGYSYEEITRPGRSLELTKLKEEILVLPNF